MSYTAYYAPTLRPGEADPTKEFPSESEAYDYVYSHMCRRCQEERELFHRLKAEGRKPEDFPEDSKEFFASDWPACACEWFVIPSEKYEEAEGFEDILDAAGYTEIYKRPEGLSEED